MNVIMVSPQFPPNFYQFCVALKKQGATVLAIGDAQYDEMRAELRNALSKYYRVEDMSNYDLQLRAVGFLIHEYGKIDRIESHNEHWLEYDARLREDFNIPGQKPAELEINRHKLKMKDVYASVGVPTAPAELVSSREQVLAFVEENSLPVILKPDVGVGASATHRVDTTEQLEELLEDDLTGYIIESFITGKIVTFDGLADADGEIMFTSSHEISEGVMEILTELLPMHYVYSREIPEPLREMGPKIVKAFGVRERFFHTEFFRTPDGEYLGLEINVRPPGGFTMDIFNYQCDFNLYDIWARMLTKGENKLNYERKYHIANVSRRDKFRYAHNHDDVLTHLGDMLALYLPMPEVFAAAMGNHSYIIRHENGAILSDAIAYIEQQAE